MSLSALIVSTLIVCRLHAHVGADSATAFLQKYTQYEDELEGEGEETQIDASHREYSHQQTTQPTAKVDRDDPVFTVGSNIAVVKPASYSRPAPNNLYTSSAAVTAASPAFGGHPQIFPTLATSSGHGGAPFAGFGLSSSVVTGGGYSYSSGRGSNFGLHGGSSFGSAGSGSFGAGHDSGGSFFGGGYGDSSDGGYHNLAPVVHKSVYVHVAPPEEDVPKQKVIFPKVAPKKNYQIVFIKAPTPPSPSVPIIPQFPQQSDKTLIYVLHAKPEEAPPIHIPAPPQNLPVKPEVYFIRYKSKKEDEPGHDSGGGFDGYHRRYGRRDGDEDIDEESLHTTDTENKAVPPDSLSDVPVNQYDDVQIADSSGESSNIVRVYFTKERGKNAH